MQTATAEQSSGLVIMPIAPTEVPMVIERPTDTAVPTAIPTVSQLQPGANYAERVGSAVCDRMQFEEDITIPDGTVVRPGQHFVKTWRIKNIGTCMWTPEYRFFFSGGDQMSSAKEVFLPAAVAPGSVLDISVEMIAPSKPGEYKSYWKLRGPSGNEFGTSGANNPIWASIKVDESAGVGHQPISSGCTIISLSPEYGTTLETDSKFEISFTVQNSGNETWTAADYDLAFIDGDNLLRNKDAERFDLSTDTIPGGYLSGTLKGRVPEDPGKYTMSLGIVKNYEVFCTINVTIKGK